MSRSPDGRSQSGAEASLVRSIAHLAREGYHHPLLAAGEARHNAGQRHAQGGLPDQYFGEIVKRYDALTGAASGRNAS